jgi:hypothetical protein
VFDSSPTPTVQPYDSSTRSRPGQSTKPRSLGPRFGALRPFDALLILLVGAIGGFVALKMVTRLPMAPPAPQVSVPNGAAGGATTSVASRVIVDTLRTDLPTETDMAASTIQSEAAAPTHDLEQILAHIAETPGTYMNDMIADLDGRLVRWPDKRQDGLRVWVETPTNIPDWDQRYAQMARDAFDDWDRDAEVPIRFDYILDSATADIRVMWANKFPASQGQRVGVTRRASDQFGWLTGGQIDIAIHDSAGRAIQPAALGGIMRHEAGHALGLGHSNDQRTKMYPTEMRSDISPADRSTLRLLYQLPPGPVRDPHSTKSGQRAR